MDRAPSYSQALREVISSGTNRVDLMGEDRATSLRFPMILALSISCLAVPAWADFQAGMDAYGRADFAAALRELRPLAEQGDSRAQFYLGLLHENGDGVPRDFVKARQWYEKSAAQGEARAQFYLGMQSAYGEGGPIDLVQAYMWYSLAAGHGNAHAPGYRDDLARQMSPAQIAEGQKRAREWRPKGK